MIIESRPILIRTKRAYKVLRALVIEYRDNPPILLNRDEIAELNTELKEIDVFIDAIDQSI